MGDRYFRISLMKGTTLFINVLVKFDKDGKARNSDFLDVTEP